MSVERLALRGKLAEAQNRRGHLRLKAEGLCSGIRTGVNTLIYDVEELEVAQAAQQMDELVATMGELAALQGQIARIERELKS